jgi:hypothetical protein
MLYESKTLPVALLLTALLATAALYWGGLNGPFLFDDSIHITQNRWVKIESLGYTDLARAWNSSFNKFPSDRPLAQLSFGVNHALAGLDPFAFKATNLALHLLTGVMVFVFLNLVVRALGNDPAMHRRGALVAAAAATFWLLHPLHVSTVLYVVQRMAQLSTLGLLVALSCYFLARIQWSRGRAGLPWLLAVVPAAAFAFLGKENAVLLPLFLLVGELTVLRRLPPGNRRSAVYATWLVFIALPLALGAYYLATHPGLIGYGGRDFTLEERVLTQARVLWIYLQWLFVPNVTAFGLFHDDIAVSTGLLAPPTTLAAIVGHAVLLVAALLLSRRQPMFAFGVLFYYAAHALESTIFPLELVFEHRNYLASVGPLLLLAYGLIIYAQKLNIARVALPLGALLLLAYSAVTHLRVGHWSSYQDFILTQAEHHPNSPRSNFQAAQVLIAALARPTDDPAAIAAAARDFLDRGLAADPNCINCLFGHIVLDMHLEQTPDPATLERLTNALRTGHVDATSVTVSQFSFLVNWLQSGPGSLSQDQLEAIFDAALANPRWNGTGRAGIHAAYRNYFETVGDDPVRALEHADGAIRAWPTQWSYRMQKARLLRKLGRLDAALRTLDGAAPLAENAAQQQQMIELRREIAHAANNHTD